MKIITRINDELIEISEYTKPNACFQTNIYPDSYDFCIFREQFNPFDLFNDNKAKDKEIDRLNNIINELEKLLEQMILDTKKPTVLNNSEKMAIRVAIQHIQDKLKELKESNNE